MPVAERHHPQQVRRAVVGCNALPLRPQGAGVSTYIRELLHALPPCVDADIVAVVAAGAEDELPGRVRPIVRPAASGARRALQGLRGGAGLSLFHGLDVDLPVRPTCPTVTTVHDLAVFDVPWAFSRRKAIGERLVTAHAIRRADVVIAVSPFTADRVRAHFGRDCVVIAEAPGRGFAVRGPDEVQRVRRRYDLPERFVLHVGTLEPRKSVAQLAAACRSVGAALVLAGAGAATAPPGTRGLGFVPSADLPALYAAATVAAYVSRYEGFGLPPLEAMACGCAVVSSPVPALELVDGATVVDPLDEKAIAAALHALVADDARRHELADRGRVSVGALSWQASAEATAAVYGSLGLPLCSSSGRARKQTSFDAPEWA